VVLYGDMAKALNLMLLPAGYLRCGSTAPWEVRFMLKDVVLDFEIDIVRRLPLLYVVDRVRKDSG